MVSKVKYEKQCLTTTMTSLNRDHKQLVESNSDNKSYYDATMKLEVATVVQNHKVYVTEFELIKKGIN